MIQYFVLLVCFCVWVYGWPHGCWSVSLHFSLRGSTDWLGLYYATYWSPCRQLNNWSACVVARPESFIVLAGITSSWSAAVLGPVVFYPLRGCSLLLHARPANLGSACAFARSDLGLRCALCGRLGPYISFMWPVMSYLAARMRRLVLVFTCCILVYCGNCCARITCFIVHCRYFLVCVCVCVCMCVCVCVCVCKT